MSEFNVSASILAQTKYCEEEHLPHFAPTDGRCWNCKTNIYMPSGWEIIHFGKRRVSNLDDAELVTGITVEKASNELVTGCPHCNRSYCD
ncbi:hypothetical protein F3157_07975 [Virgibacillus dakarensis]|nr:hypothetical protein [Virgibacillus dakarensis]